MHEERRPWVFKGLAYFYKAVNYLATTITLRGIEYTLPSADGTSGQFIATDGSGTLTWTTGTGNTLDQSYDQGGAGSGRAITVDSGAVALTNNAANNNGVLTLGKSPVGAQSGDALTITMGAQATGDCIQFANSGSGNDLAGSGGTWSITAAGAATFSSLTGLTAGITVTGGAISLNASSNFAVNIATGTSTGAVSIGGGSNTVAVNSSSWDISTAGAMSGFSTLSLSGDITLANGKAVKSSTTNAETVALQCYDVDGGAYVNSILLTNGNTPSIVIGTGAETVAINSSDWDVSATGDITAAGAITCDGLITGALGLTITGAVVSLNESSNFAVNIGTGTSTGTVTVGGAANQAIAIGTGAAVKTVTLGSTNTTSSTGISSGSGGVNVNVSNNQPTNINSGTSTGTVTIGGTGVMQIDVGAGGTGAKTLNIGDGASTGATVIKSGSGGLSLNASVNAAVNIGTGTSTGTVTIGGSVAQQIDIGNGAAAKTVNVGSSNTTSTTTLLSGSGGIALNASNNQPVNIGTGTCTGTVTIGGAGEQTINIGDGAAAKTVTLGSTTTTSTTTVSAGSGGLILQGEVTFKDATELTLSGDAITVTQSYHTVDTESDDATDDLSTINGGAAGQILILKPANGGRDVVVKHAVGNIQCGSDFTMDNANDTIALIFDGSNWLQLFQSNNGA